ncbi:MAG: tyrosine-type recombinase/integrase [Planctomycetes bacterium]|nr:tyrosine-type recombinase/integrase [Planctomycetota bacterium]
MHLLSALDRYQTQLAANGRSPHTRHQYRRHIHLLARWLASRRHSGDLRAIGHETVAAFLTSPAARLRPDGRPKKGSAMNGLRSSLRAFFGWVHAAGYVPSNPVRFVERARCAPPPPRGLSPAEQSQLLHAFTQAVTPEERRDAAFYSTLLHTGIRIGNAVQLDIDDLDLERQELRLRHAKGDREEVVYLNPAAQRVLGEAIGKRSAGPVFVGRHGGRVSARNMQRRFRGWLRRAGIARAYSPHGLRHAFGLRIYEKTGDILVTQAALHHRSICSTLVYVRVPEQRLRQALQA